MALHPVSFMAALAYMFAFPLVLRVGKYIALVSSFVVVSTGNLLEA